MKPWIYFNILQEGKRREKKKEIDETNPPKY